MSNPTALEAATATSPIDTRFDILSQKVATVAAQVDQLQNKLNPVLSPESPTVGEQPSGPGADSMPVSNLSYMLDGLTTTVDSINRQLAEIMERIEV